MIIAFDTDDLDFRRLLREIIAESPAVDTVIEKLKAEAKRLDDGSWCSLDFEGAVLIKSPGYIPQ